MTKAEMVNKIAQDAGITKKQAEAALESVAVCVVSSVNTGENTRIAGLGTFKLKTYAARTGRNPKTGESIPIPARTAIGFKQSK